jgi:NAD(P)H-dependent FMN reductase
MGLTVSVLLGSSRLGRQSVRVALHLLKKLAEIPNVSAQLLDLAEYAFPILEQRPEEMDEPPERLHDFISKLRGADAILIVAPEYKNGYPGVLKNALDYLPSQIFKRKPVAICTVSAGGLGGLNCLAQLRLVCLGLGGMPIPEILPISNVQDSFTEDGDSLDPRLAKKTRALLEELLWHAEAMSNHSQFVAQPEPVPL